jgi:5,5'-dehydrodivanillate O-demethylase
MTLAAISNADDSSNIALREFARVSPDSPMGELLRKFWHPVALSRDIEVGKAKPIRALGENLALYRGDSGKAFLVANRCAHRLTFLHTGWVEGDRIRCIYHGWQYDGTGRCLERPAEPSAATGHIKIAGYPVHEYHGMIFAYFGSGEPPAFDLPRKHALDAPDRRVYARGETWPCNWFQMVENSLDATHVSFVHRAGHIGPFGQAITAAIPQLTYTENEAGLEQVAVRSKTNVRVSDWTFPNNNHIVIPVFLQEEPWLDVVIWMVPVDETHATRFIMYSVPEEIVQKYDFDAYFAKYGDYNPTDVEDELMLRGIYPKEPIFQLTGAQDYVATVGQGPIVQTEFEKLGKSDAGIARLRRLFMRELGAIQNGRPTKEWRRRPVAPEMRRTAN